MLLVVLMKRIVVHTLSLKRYSFKQKFTQLPLRCLLGNRSLFLFSLLLRLHLLSFVFNNFWLLGVDYLQDFKFIQCQQLVFASEILWRAVTEYLKLKIA
jgi:hypothetical protein